jgi:hypothetical protein
MRKEKAEKASSEVIRVELKKELALPPTANSCDEAMKTCIN